MVDLQWRSETESFSWSPIESIGYRIALMLRHFLHALAFWQVLADESIGVLIGGAFPRAVGRRKVEFHPGRLLNRLIAMKF